MNLRIFFFSRFSTWYPPNCLFFPFHHRASQFNVIRRNEVKIVWIEIGLFLEKILTEIIWHRICDDEDEIEKFISIIYTFGPSPRLESSLLVNVLLVSMPESFVVESWLSCRSLSQRENSSNSWPSNRTVFFRRSVNRRLSPDAASSTNGSSVSLK